MEVSSLSERYSVRELGPSDVPRILSLCRGNPLFYRHCPPPPSQRRILRDMSALPPRSRREDKHYLGYFDGEKLIAVMDLILGYPDGEAAFIGFFMTDASGKRPAGIPVDPPGGLGGRLFMTDASVQHAGVGSGIVEELCAALARAGVRRIRLGWVRGNPQAEGFWRRNGFTRTGVTYETDGYTVVVAQREL